MSDWDDLINVINAANNVYGTVANIKQNNANLQRTEDLKREAERKAAEKLEANRVYNLQQNQAVGDYKDSLGDLKTAINTLQLHGVTNDAINNQLKQVDRTPDMQNIIDSGMATAQEDLSFTYNAANNSRGTLDNINSAAALNRLNLMELNNMLSGVEEVKYHNQFVGKGLGIEFVEDAADYEAYKEMPQYAHIFKIPHYDEVGQPLVDDDGNIQYSDVDNYKAQAFTHELRNLNGLDYGNVPSYEKWQINEIKSSLGLVDPEVAKAKISSDFEMFRKGYDDMYQMDVKDHDAWADAYNLTGLLGMQGGVNTWEDPEKAGMLKKELEKTILSIWNDATLNIMDKESDNPDRVAQMEQLRKDLGFITPIVYNEETEQYEKGDEDLFAVLGDAELTHKAVKHIYDKYINNSRSRIASLDGAGGLFSIDYANDGLYLGADRPPGPSTDDWQFGRGKTPDKVIYGTGAKDKVYYNVIKLWGSLDNVYDTKRTTLYGDEAAMQVLNNDELFPGSSSAQEFISMWDNPDSGIASGVETDMNKDLLNLISNTDYSTKTEVMSKFNPNSRFIDFESLNRNIYKEIDTEGWDTQKRMDMKKDIYVETLNALQGKDLKNDSNLGLTLKTLHENIYNKILSKYKTIK